MIIEKQSWTQCKICHMKLEEMIHRYKEKGKYKSQYFQSHLLDDHDMSLNDYFNNNEVCPCGICNKKLDIITKGANIVYKKLACGRNQGVLKWSQLAKETRKGKNNPMFNKKPWNTGLTKEISDSVMSISEKMSNRIVSDTTKKKQSNSAKKRQVHGHTGHKHSEQTKHKLRLNTLLMIKNGKFKQLDTKPSIVFEKILNDLNISYEKEKQVDCWSFDFYLIDYDVYIEVDGDYFHSNPKLFPLGPKTKTQKVNYYRDSKKNKFCEEKNINLIRIWESEIFGEQECVKQKLLALNILD